MCVQCRFGLSEHLADTRRVFDIKLDDEDRERIAAVTRKARNLMDVIGDCGDEYRG